MTRTLHGKVCGKTIELDEELGIDEGQEVEIQLKLMSVPAKTPGEGFLRTEGALAEDEEWDGIMEEIYKARKVERSSPLPELSEP
jgi:hypothetical protein